MKEFSKLLHVLNDELGAQEKLLEVLSKERAAIVALNQQAIEASNSEKQVLLEQAGRREAQRAEVIKQIAGEESDEERRLSKLLEQCPSPQLRAELETLGTELKATAEAVRRMNTHNSELVKYSLGFISSTMSIMHSAPDRTPTTYGQSGKTSETNKKKSASSGRLRTSV